jgi:Phage integrase, N-terminal SAM-like domain
VRWTGIARLPMVLQHARAAKLQIVACSRHSICLKGPFNGELIQRLGALAQTGFAGVGCKPFQCWHASTGSALSGCSVCGAAHGGTASDRKRRLRINITPAQAQCHTGRIGAMTVRGLSVRTIECYTESISRLSRHCYGINPARLSPEQIEAYLLHLIKDRKLSYSSVRLPVQSQSGGARFRARRLEGASVHTTAAWVVWIHMVHLPRLAPLAFVRRVGAADER